MHNSHNPKDVKLVIRFRLTMSHLRKHKFKHSFQDSINPLCNRGHEVEPAFHFFSFIVLYSQTKEGLSLAL